MLLTLLESMFVFSFLTAEDDELGFEENEIIRSEERRVGKEC